MEGSGSQSCNANIAVIQKGEHLQSDVRPEFVLSFPGSSLLGGVGFVLLPKWTGKDCPSAVTLLQEFRQALQLLGRILSQLASQAVHRLFSVDLSSRGCSESEVQNHVCLHDGVNTYEQQFAHGQIACSFPRRMPRSVQQTLLQCDLHARTYDHYAYVGALNC